MQGEGPSERSVNLTNGDKYNFDYSSSPVDSIKRHENYYDKYEMIVVCGQRDSLKDLIRANMISFVEYHVTAF